MKKLIILLTLATALFTISCKEKEGEEEKQNNYANTSWTAIDDIAEFIYGGNCTTTIEFYEDFSCQEIDKRTGGLFGGNTSTELGTYILSNDSVYWTIGKITIGGIAKGSVMTTNISKMSGGTRIYTKD